MKKKIIALICAIAMATSVTACGNETGKPVEESEKPAASSEKAESEPSSEPVVEKKEPVTIVYWYRNNVGEQEYTDEVEAKLNEMLAADEATAHITLDLHPTKDYATDFALAQASGEQIDLVSTPALNYETEVFNGSFIVLDDLLAQYPEATEELPDWLVEMGKVNGETYIVPNYQQASNMQYIEIPKAYLDMAGYTVEDVEVLFQNENRTPQEVADFMEKLVLAVRKETGKETKWLSNSLSSPAMWHHPGNEEIVLASYNQLSWNADTQEFTHAYSNPTMAEAHQLAGDLYSKGLIHPDSATINGNNFVGANFMNDESFVINMVGGMRGDTEMSSAMSTEAYGFEMVSVPMWDYYYVSSRIAAGGLAISATSENPEECMQIITMLMNSKYSDFYNTLCYGIEGVHYEKLTENTINTLEFSGSQGGADTTYAYWKWCGGNTFNAWINQSSTPELQDYILNEVNEGENTVISPFIGKTFDLSALETEKSQVVAVTKEYLDALWYGILGSEGTAAYLKEYQDKLESAGLSKILDAVNTQAKEYVK